jgi:uncharacterized protein (TIRG00374 family)
VKVSRWRRALFWLGVALSLVCLWLVARRVEWLEVLETVRTASWGLVVLGALLLIAAWALFAVRWQVLFSPMCVTRWLDAFSLVMIGYLGSIVLPLRAGEVTRVVLMSQKYKVNVGFASATVVVERLLDVLTIVVFAAILMSSVPVDVGLRYGIQVTAVASLGAFVVLVLLSQSQGVVARLRSALASRLPERILVLGFGLVERFVQGLQVVKSLSQMLKTGLLSVLSWGLAGLALWCYTRAFRLPVPWQAGPLVLIVTNLGGAIPSSPGGIGVYEFLAMSVISVWVPEQSVSLGFAGVVHALSLGMSLGLGLLAAWREGVRLSALSGGQSLAGEAYDAQDG